MYAGQLPDRLELIAQHYENMFEVPILFLITCTVFLALDEVNVVTLVLAWIFVISRGFHAWIHLGRNKVMKRAASFGVGWLALVLLWLQLTFFALT